MLVIVLLVSFFLLLFIGVPISFALSISSFTAVMTTGAIPVINLVQKTFRAIDSFTLLAIPFFVFAGNVMARGGVSKRLTDMAATLVGRMPGGLVVQALLNLALQVLCPEAHAEGLALQHEAAVHQHPEGVAGRVAHREH